MPMRWGSYIGLTPTYSGPGSAEYSSAAPAAMARAEAAPFTSPPQRGSREGLPPFCASDPAASVSRYATESVSTWRDEDRRRRARADNMPFHRVRIATESARGSGYSERCGLVQQLMPCASG